jgi:hypothetical protein
MSLSQRLGRRPSRSVHPRRRFRPGFEALEDRLVPATLFTVNTLADNTNTRDQVLTLREALRVQQGLLGLNNLTSGEQAQIQANAPGLTQDTIRFAPSLAGGTLLLNQAWRNADHVCTFGPSSFELTKSVEIDGDPSLGLTLQRDATAPAFRLFEVTAGASLTLQDLTLEGGLAQGGNGGFGGGGGAAGMGGAVFNLGTLTVRDSTFEANRAAGGNGGDSDLGSTDGAGGSNGSGGKSNFGDGAAGGDVNTAGTPGFGGGGGGAFEGGNVGFAGGSGGRSATPFGNVGFGGGGGGGLGGAVFNAAGSVALTNVTFTANTAQGGNGGNGAQDNGGGGSGYGGALFNLNGLATLVNDTLANNGATAGAGGTGSSAGQADGADVYNLQLAGVAPRVLPDNPATVALTDTILANPSGGSDLVNDPTHPGTLQGTHNLATQAGLPAAVFNLVTANALELAGLAANNGPTPTMALGTTSAARDAGVLVAGVTPTDDQRGSLRPDNGPIDAGAYQHGFALYEVNSLADTDTRDGVLTLREALRVQQGLLPLASLTTQERAQVKWDGGLSVATIQFAPALAGDTVLLEQAWQNRFGATTFGPSAFEVTRSVAIDGDPSAGITLQRDPAAPAFRLFYVAAGASLTLQDLTLTNGLAHGGNGGSVLGAGYGGGGGGAAGLGGAVFNRGTLTVRDSTLTKNVAGGGGGGDGSGGTSGYSGAPGGGGVGGDGGAFDGTAHAGGGGGGVAGPGAPNQGGTSGAGGANAQGVLTPAGQDGTPPGGGGGGASTGSTGTGNKGDIGGGGGGNLGPGGNGGFAGGGGGGYSGGSGGGGGGGGLGGAVFNAAGAVTFTNVTLTANFAQGGPGGGYSDGTSGGAGGSGYGGALFNLNGSATLVNDTLANNGAKPGTAGAGGSAGQADGADVYNLQLTGTGLPDQAASLTLTDSILADARTGSGRDLVNDAGHPGTVNGGPNLVMTSAGPLAAGVVALTADPLLAPLANYGGPAPTFALLPGSPALDAGTAANDPATGQPLATDQRGVARPQGAAPDLGAFESRGFTLTVLGGSNQSASVGSQFAQKLDVRVTANDPGVPVTSGVIAFAVSSASNGAAATLSAATVTLGGSSEASVIATANTTAGNYSVTASAAVSVPATFSLTNLPGAAAASAASAGTPQSAPVGTAFAAALQATVTDAYGNAVPGVTVTFTAPATGASGSFAGGVTTATTDTHGVATAPAFTASVTAGSYTVTASTAGVSAPASFSLTNQPGAAAAIAASAGTPQSATVGTAFGTALQATVTDAFGNAVPGVTVTFADVASGAGGSFAGAVSTATTDAHGVATAPTFIANTTAGSYTVTASAGVFSSARFSLTNQPGTAAAIVASSGTPQSAPVGTSFAAALQATVTDAFGNAVPGVTVTFTAPATGATGSFVLGLNRATTDTHGIATMLALTAGSTAGSYSVTASAAGVSVPATFSLTNQTGAAAILTATAGTPQSTTVGTAFAAALQATVTDAFGNAVPGVTVTFATSSTGASGSFAGGVTTATTDAHGVATAPAFTANATAGSYTVQATAAGLTAANFALTNTALPALGATDIVSVQVDDGSVQRSMVRSLTVTFDRAGVVPAGLFEVDRRGGGTVGLNVTATVVNGVTVATLTFSGPGVVGGSLADGRYTLTAGGTAVTVPNFFRLFGDINGDAKVDATDLKAFLAAYRSKKGYTANYNAYFDYNAHGLVDGRDYYEILARYGTAV